MVGVGDVYKIHTTYLWWVWEKYTEYTKSLWWVWEKYTEYTRSLWWVWEKHTKYTLHPCAGCGRSHDSSRYQPCSGAVIHVSLLVPRRKAIVGWCRARSGGLARDTVLL